MPRALHYQEEHESNLRGDVERLLVSNPGNMHGNIGATPLSRGDDMSPEFNGVERVPMTRKKLLEEFYPQSKMEDYLITRQKSGTYEF